VVDASDKGRPHGPGGRCFLNFSLDLVLMSSIGNEIALDSISLWSVCLLLRNCFASTMIKLV
jgi:hypothetical protein